MPPGNNSRLILRLLTALKLWPFQHGRSFSCRDLRMPYPWPHSDVRASDEADSLSSRKMLIARDFDFSPLDIPSRDPARSLYNWRGRVHTGPDDRSIGLVHFCIR